MASVTWEFDPDETRKVESIVEDQENDPFVSKRVQNNVREIPAKITRSGFWDAQLTALVTSQQRSGPDSPVSRFIQENLDQLNVKKCDEASDIQGLVSSTLESHGGVRFYNNIGEACEKNHRLLYDDGHWDRLLNELESLRDLRTRDPNQCDAERERKVCEFIYDGVGGEGLHRIGPKQSRNLLQIMGLTRYETPLDSRISGWINTNLDFPYHITGAGLNNPEFYNFHMDLIQALCAESGVLPCIFDAAVFSSYDSGWTEEQADSTF